MTNFFNKGIVRPHSRMETTQQNSNVEHRHQYILIVTRALVFQFQLPICFFIICYQALCSFNK